VQHSHTKNIFSSFKDQNVSESELYKLIETNYNLWNLRYSGIENELEAAKENYIRSKQFNAESVQTDLFSYAAMNYGLSLWAMSKFEEALPIIEEAVSLSKAANEKKIASFGLAFLANIYSN